MSEENRDFNKKVENWVNGYYVQKAFANLREAMYYSEKNLATYMYRVTLNDLNTAIFCQDTIPPTPNEVNYHDIKK